MKVLNIILIFWQCLIAFHSIQAHKYTQTEAYLRVWFKIPAQQVLTKYDVEQLVLRMFTLYEIDQQKLAVYLPLFMKMIEREKIHQNLYVFYHAYNRYTLTSFFDMLREVYNILTNQRNNEYVPLIRDIIRMQDEWKTIFPYQNAEEFLNSPLQPSTTNMDNRPPLMDFLLSVNLSIFANFGEGFGYHPYSSFGYFNLSISRGGRGVEHNFFNYWGFDPKYGNEINKLYAAASENTLLTGEMLQIFIPENLIDTLVYASEALAFPQSRKITATFDEKLKRHTDMLSILQLYRNDPYKIDIYDFNRVQGRILLIPAFFDPTSGIKIFRYNVNPESKNREYYQKLREVVKKMILDWLKSPRSEELIQKYHLSKKNIYESLGIVNYKDYINEFNVDVAIIYAMT